MAADTARDLLHDILGPIRPILAREDVTDLCINGPGLLFVEDAHGLARRRLQVLESRTGFLQLILQLLYLATQGRLADKAVCRCLAEMSCLSYSDNILEVSKVHRR